MSAEKIRLRQSEDEFKRVFFVVHRAPDGQILFYKKDPDPALPPDRSFRYLFSLKMGEIKGMLPGLAEELFGRETYAGLNDFFLPFPWTDPLTGKQIQRKTKDNLRWLNTCHVDLDFYKKANAPTAVDAAGKVRKLAEGGALPWPSVFVYTGQGLCLLWLLRGESAPADDVQLAENHPHPELAFRKNRNRCEALNEALQYRLWELNPDKSQTATSSIARVYGSLNVKAGDQMVQAEITVGDRGLPIFYTLSELAEILETAPDVKEILRPKRKGRGPIKNRGSAPARRAGHDAFVEKTLPARIRDLRKFEDFLDGFPQGRRRKSLLLLAVWLYTMGRSRAAIIREMRIQAKRCRPPYPSDESDATINKIFEDVETDFRKKKWSNKLVCQFLEISGDVARSLRLEALLPPEMDAERKKAKREARREARPPSRRAQARQHRFDVYASLLEAGSGDISFRRLQTILTGRGLRASLGLLHREWRAARIDFFGRKKRVTIISTAGIGSGASFGIPTITLSPTKLKKRKVKK